ncbi:unnamed protein product [Clavelina lepadiformis]|uniref:Membrane-associated transporter protein n=1 Tax=Clavelina lepadiformis TaxID=159417 RepID=A0ABP0FBE3_CLALP
MEWITSNEYVTNSEAESTSDSWPVRITPSCRGRADMRRKKRRFSLSSLPRTRSSIVSACASIASPRCNRPQRSAYQLLLNSSIMFGREFCYAIEAGLTTPILLSIGLPANMYSLVWVISPVIGFILQPIIGNLSDRCSCRWGKRRPFIFGLAILLLLGLSLFLNGEQIVALLRNQTTTHKTIDSEVQVISYKVVSIILAVVGVVIFDFSADFIEGPIRAYIMDVCNEEDTNRGLLYQAIFTGAGGAMGYASGGISWTKDTKLGLIFATDRQVVYCIATFLFTITCVCNLLSISENNLIQASEMDIEGNTFKKHLPLAKGQNTESGVVKNGIDQNERSLYAKEDKSEKRAEWAEKKVLKILTKEKREFLLDNYEKRNLRKLPEHKITDRKNKRCNVMESNFKTLRNKAEDTLKPRPFNTKRSMVYGTFTSVEMQATTGSFHKSENIVYHDLSSRKKTIAVEAESSILPEKTAGIHSRNSHVTDNKDAEVLLETPFPPQAGSDVSLDNEAIGSDAEKHTVKLKSVLSTNSGGVRQLLHSIRSMPKNLRCLCVCHLLGWISFLCMALFFTDFVGEIVMHGDPRATRNSRSEELYLRGVQIGNWGLTINAAVSSVYCVALKSMIKRFGAKRIYVMGYCLFGTSSCIIALSPNILTVLVFSAFMGIMSATLYTIPYLLVAQYHEKYKSEALEERGIGTDCALITCMIQLAQIITGLVVGTFVSLLKSVTVTMTASSLTAFAGAAWGVFCVHY